MDIIYWLLVQFFKLVTFIFFRAVATSGSHFIPKKGPVIFVVAPHANQFVDPIILMTTCFRKVSFLMAKVSLKRKFIGKLGELLGAIPVSRPGDEAILGSGTVQFATSASENDMERNNTNTLIKGTGTFFSKQFKASQHSVCLPGEGGSYKVEKIISDELLLLSKTVNNSIGISMLKSGTKYSITPILDQSTLYSNIKHKLIHESASIGIFPEGGSHDQPEMLPLKAGVAIMALEAMAEDPSVDVQIIPTGLNYFHPHEFRSRAMIEYGRPIRIPHELIEKYKLGGEAKKEALGVLLNKIYEQLKEVTINVPDYETLQVIQMTRRLYKPTKTHLNSFEMLNLTRRFIKGYMHFKNDERIIKLKESIKEYEDALSIYSLRDHQVVKSLKRNGLHSLLLLLSRVFALAMLESIALPGRIINFLPTLVITAISKKKAKEAKMKSSVKIEGRDVLATWKLLIGLVLIPFLNLIYAFLFCWAFPELNAGFLSLFLVILPLIEFGTVLADETERVLWQSIRTIFLGLFKRNQVHVLYEMRCSLRDYIIEIVERLGPELFSNFHKDRVIDKKQHDMEKQQLSPVRKRGLAAADAEGPLKAEGIIHSPIPTRPTSEEASELDNTRKSKSSSPSFGFMRRSPSFDLQLDAIATNFSYMQESFFKKIGDKVSTSIFDDDLAAACDEE